ncbi:MAG: hypothetical protein SGI77_01355 [Pirellulaceae bacterium]|nr:hypothetical protein [Pirellulaceae bacterium]
MTSPRKRERRFATLRLTTQDKELLKRLGSPSDAAPDRHNALIAIAGLIAQLELPAIDSRRQPIRLGIPPELDRAIELKRKATGQTALAILLAGARAYLESQQSPAEQLPAPNASKAISKTSIEHAALTKRRPGRPRKSPEASTTSKK